MEIYKTLKFHTDWRFPLYAQEKNTATQYILRWRCMLPAHFFSIQNFSSKTTWKPLHTIHFQKAEYLNFSIRAMDFYET